MQSKFPFTAVWEFLQEHDRDFSNLNVSSGDHNKSGRPQNRFLQPPSKARWFCHLGMHEYIFGDLYEWAGIPRTISIYKEEDVLGGQSNLIPNPQFISEDGNIIK